MAELDDIRKKIGMYLFSPALWKARIKYGKNYINESDDPKVKAYLKLCDFIKTEKEAYKEEQEKVYEREEKGRENPEYVKVVNTQEFPKPNSMSSTTIRLKSTPKNTHTHITETE